MNWAIKIFLIIIQLVALSFIALDLFEVFSNKYISVISYLIIFISFAVIFVRETYN